MGQIPPIPVNIKEVSEVEELMSLFRNQTLDSPKLTIIHMILKAARRAMADRVILNLIIRSCLQPIRKKNDEFSILVFNTIVKVLEFLVWRM